MPVAASTLPEDPAELIKYADAEMRKQTPQGAANALEALKKALGKQKSYEAAWRAARACSWLSDDFEDNSSKKDWADKGLTFAKEAGALDGSRVEGHYYHALTLGQYLYVEQTKARQLVPQVLEEVKKAVQIDEKFDHAGPLRLLGSLLSQAPEPPTSVGDHEEGMKVLTRATNISPGYPQNWLLLGDALKGNRNLDTAEDAYNRVLAAQPGDSYSHFLPRWQKQAQEALKKVENLRRQKSSGREAPF
jgi:tetratricopeptide (TPR) repeat protein